jgi:hypothetical protein
VAGLELLPGQDGIAPAVEHPGRLPGSQAADQQLRAPQVGEPDRVPESLVRWQGVGPAVLAAAALAHVDQVQTVPLDGGGDTRHVGVHGGGGTERDDGVGHGNSWVVAGIEQALDTLPKVDRDYDTRTAVRG